MIAQYIIEHIIELLMHFQVALNNYHLTIVKIIIQCYSLILVDVLQEKMEFVF